MHLLLALFVSLTLAATSFAQQQAPGPPVWDVFVTNDPLDVNVTNPPTAVAPRWQLVGFTTATYGGNMGGHFGVTAKCQLDFANSRMCTLEEVAATTSIPGGLTGEAWAHGIPVDTSSNIFSANMRRATEEVGHVSNNCGGWTFASDSVAQGTTVEANGVVGDGNLCQTPGPLPIACCALVP
jgi:hypothetical protein